MRTNYLANFILVFGCIVVVAAVFNFSYDGVPDTDSFYHIRHAWLYRTQGILENSFPWAQYSAIRHYAADIWYGFHILLLPLTYFSDFISAVKIGGFFVTLISLFFLFAAISRLRIKWPLLWVLLFYFAAADPMFRLTMLRPHAISLALGLLIFAYLVKVDGFPDRNDAVILFFLSAAFSWIHLSLAWTPILTAGIIGLVRFLKKQPIDWLHAAGIGLGLITGWLLRPAPIGAAKLAFIQVVQLMLEKSRGLPLRFGRELTPFVWENFFDQLLPLAILLIIAAALVFWLFSRKINISDSVWASMILTAIFSYLTFGVARRSSEILVGFAVIFLGLVFTHYRSFVTSSEAKSLLTIVLAIVLIYMPVKSIYRFQTYIRNAFEPHRFQETSLWLKNNTRPGAIVFNIHWDRFAQLFFWNWDNYYINGMDPIFQYAFSPELYWKTHFLAIDQATAVTCGEIRCTAEAAEDTVSVLKNDFKASYIVIENRRNPKLYKYVNSHPKFQKSFETADETVFKIL